MNIHKLETGLQNELRKQTLRLRPVNDENLTKVVEKFDFLQEPYLEKIAYYQLSTENLKQLAEGDAETRLLEPKTVELFTKYFDCDDAEKVKLYEHQTSAIESIKNGKNLVVCTGTGSGKTESFLIPVINEIIKEKNENGNQYQKGVRAMLLYPMNALVNDQLKRIRKLLKGTDITYGIYTGELAEVDNNSLPYKYSNNGYDQEARRQRRDERRAVDNALTGVANDTQVNEWPTIKTSHYSFIDDESPENEYTDRRTWRDQGAPDIMITNFSMLERLLLDPEKTGIFSQTWRFIVLDEAHSYDGGLGTDIAWLLKRVVQRTRSNQIQYIATSATLVDDNTSMESKQDRIKKEFAAPLFSVDADSVDVNLGNVHPEELENQDGVDFDYVSVVSSKVENIDEFNFESEYIQFIPPVSSEVENIDEFNFESKYTSLIGLTQWLTDQKKFSKIIRDFCPAQQMSLGDAVHMAKILSMLNPEQMLKIQGSPLFALVGKVLRIDHIDAERLVSDVSGLESRKELSDLTRLLGNIGIDQENPALLSVTLACKYVTPFALIARRIMDQLYPEYEKLAEVSVTWENDTWQTLQQISDECGRFADAVSEWEVVVKNKWKECTGIQNADTIEDCVTSYLLRFSHVEKLQQVFRNVSKSADKVTASGSLERSKIAQEVFGTNDTAAKNQFEALTTLLSLSKHPDLFNKPLMDLRYHQIVSGITEMAVCFKKGENGIVTVDYLENDARVMDEDNNILYSLGVCFECFHPFILGYSKVVDQNNTAVLSRYQNDDNEKFCAYSWKRPDNVDDLVLHALNFKTGEIRFLANENGPLNEDEICLYYHRFVEDGTTYIETCPACKAEDSTNKETANYGIVAPYSSGADILRTSILHYLVQHADPQSGMGETLSEGRKVLAFSDSRTGAARLAIGFDSHIERRLLERLVYDSLFEAQNNPLEIQDYITKNIQDIECGTYTRAEYRHAKRDARHKPNPQQSFYDALYEALEYVDYKYSLQYAVSFLRKKIKRANATRLLDKEFYDVVLVNNSAQVQGSRPFTNDYASASLLALYALRSVNPKSLIKAGYVKPYLVQEDPDEFDCFNDVLNIRFSNNQTVYAEFEQQFITRLFSYYKLSCARYDSIEGTNYEKETGELIAGFEGFAKRKLEAQCPGNRTELWKMVKTSLLKVHGEVDDNLVCNTLSDYWTALIQSNTLIQEGENLLLNLEKLRFKINPQKNIKEITEILKYFRIEEHTAQLSKETAALNQYLFANGRINILSCSTTFEMGVDLGDLNCVFMNNLPPKVANYKQRAGRAGRRPGSASYVLTVVGGSPHDLYYKPRPYELFFGSMKMPIFYMENPTFKAKHYRAVAFANFLSYLSQERIAWKQSGSFFVEKKVQRNNQNREFSVVNTDRAVPILPQVNKPQSMLKQWLEISRDEVQSLCMSLNGNIEIPYTVADDFAYQLSNEVQVDDEYVKYFKRNSELLCGPRLAEGDDNLSLQKKYRERYDTLMNEGLEKSVNRMLTVQTVEELADKRVLPRYGFPCGNISLRPDKNDREGRRVEMERPKSTGIFEYAPKQVITANKRCFTSRKPLFSANCQRYSFGQAQRNKFLYWCKDCCGYFVADNNESPCTMCKGNNAESRSAIEPDAFVANKSEKASARGYKKSAPKYCVYSGGGIDNLAISIKGMVAKPADKRALLYVNRDGWRDNDIVHDLIYEAQTDMVLWKLNEQAQLPDNWDDMRLKNAWLSAMQAILSAVSKVINISDRDIDGLLVQRDEAPVIVLYDNSASGNGALLGLMPSANPDLNKKVEATTLDVLKAAINICKKCPNCGRELSEAESQKTPGSPQDCHRAPDEFRPRQACYHCIMRYENQNMHSKLDVHDALVILNAMLGAHPAGPNPDGGNPGSGGVTNSPGDGKQETDSQDSQKGGATASATETVGCNCGTSSAPTGITGETIPPAPPVTTRVYKQIDEDEIAQMQEGLRQNVSYLIFVGGGWKECRLQLSKETEACFLDENDDIQTVSYACIYKD